MKDVLYGAVACESRRPVYFIHHYFQSYVPYIKKDAEFFPLNNVQKRIEKFND